MYVTYKTFSKEGELVYEKESANCFSETFNKKWDHMHLLIKTVTQTEKKKDFWIDLLREIEPRLEYLDEEKTYLKVPYLESIGKTLFILTAIRYLWEKENHYHYIPKMAYKIRKKYPHLSAMKTLVLAASSTTKASGWGHSIVCFYADRLPSKEQYDIYYGSSVHDFCGKNNGERMGRLGTLHKIRVSMKTKFDFKPIIEFYKDQLPEIFENEKAN